MRKLLEKQGVTPATVVTDKRGSYSSALRDPRRVYNVFNIQRHLTSRRTLRVFRDQAMLTWRQATFAA
jgi:transposase-like protein